MRRKKRKGNFVELVCPYCEGRRRHPPRLRCEYPYDDKFKFELVCYLHYDYSNRTFGMRKVVYQGHTQLCPYCAQFGRHAHLNSVDRYCLRCGQSWESSGNLKEDKAMGKDTLTNKKRELEYKLKEKYDLGSISIKNADLSLWKPIETEKEMLLREYPELSPLKDLEEDKFLEQVDPLLREVIRLRIVEKRLDEAIKDFPKAIEIAEKMKWERVREIAKKVKEDMKKQNE